MVERGTCPKSLMERSKGCQELSCILVVCYVWNQSVPLVGCPALPFIDQGENKGYRWEKEKKTKGKKVLRGCWVFLFP